MKKYLLLLSFAFLALNIFSLLTPMNASAAAPGDAGPGSTCGGDSETDPPPCYDVGCIPPPICQAGLKCVNGSCQDPASMQTIACSCKNKTPTTNNEATGGNAITCPGLPDIFCNFSGDACYDGGTEPVPETKINLKGNDAAYKSKIITGVSCNPKQLIAVCTCNPVPNKNGFDCHLESDPTVKGTATCSLAKACVASTDGSLMNEAANQLGELFAKGSKTNNSGVNIKGVKCVTKADKAYPTVPPPPPPPCLTWSGGAPGKGTCTQFGTAVGALGTAPEQFVTKLFAVLLSLSGGIAILLIIRSGYQLMNSQGKPEAINGARDQLTAAIVGLIFLIFSFVVLQVIGFDILRIPGFGGAGAGTTQGGNGVAGAPCDTAGNGTCGNGLTCVSSGTGNGRSGTCQ